MLITDHEAFDYERIAAEAKLILDCRSAFASRGITGENIVKL